MLKYEVKIVDSLVIIKPAPLNIYFNIKLYLSVVTEMTFTFIISDDFTQPAVYANKVTLSMKYQPYRNNYTIISSEVQILPVAVSIKI